MDDLETTQELDYSTEETIEGESIEESLAAAFEEVDGRYTPEPEKTEEKTEKEPESNPLSEAARTLANSKKKGKRKVVEAAELQPVKEEVPPVEKEQAHIPEIPPPARFTTAKKEWFNRLPREAKEEIAKGWNEIESNTTKMWQELQRERAQVQEVSEVIKYYAPLWHKDGLTIAQGFAELAATRENLKKDRVGEIARIMQLTGTTPDEIAERLGGGQQQQPRPVTQDPQYFQLNQKLDSVYNYFTASQQAQQQAAIQAEVNALEGLRQETDASGSLKYPELWDDNGQDSNFWNRGYLQRVQPLVEGLQKTQPGLSTAEATRKAVETLRILDGKPSSPSLTTSPRLSQSQEIARARAASVSVKGRGNPAVPSVAEPKANESIEETLRAVWNGTNSGF